MAFKQLSTITKKEKEQLLNKYILLIAEGNINAMDDLYELIKTDIYAYALSKVVNEIDAEDIMQDTFLNIYKNAKLYTPLGKPMAWVITIETNIINRYFQLKKRIVNVDEAIFDKESPYQSNEDILIHSALIEDIFSHLKADERQIITLHIVSDLKFREIAEILKLPLSTVLSKYNRSMKKIKNLRSKK